MSADLHSRRAISVVFAPFLRDYSEFVGPISIGSPILSPFVRRPASRRGKKSTPCTYYRLDAKNVDSDVDGISGMKCFLPSSPSPLVLALSFVRRDFRCRR